MSKDSFPPISKQVGHARYAFPGRGARGRGALDVLCIGKEACHSDYLIEREKFGAYGIEFVASGRGELVLDGKNWPLRAGTIFCYGPRTAHRILSDPAGPMTKFFINIAGPKAASALRIAKLQPGRVLHIPDLEQFQNLFESMLGEGLRDGAGCDEICRKYFEILLLKTGSVSSASTVGLNRMAESFLLCKNQIDGHFKTLRDLEDIAGCVHFDPAYICRLFRRFGHQSPFQYLVSKKLNHAAELLLSASMSIKQVGFEVGYGDAYHFSRSFSRFFGMPPKTFAESHRRH